MPHPQKTTGEAACRAGEAGEFIEFTGKPEALINSEEAGDKIDGQGQDKTEKMPKQAVA